MKWCVGRLRPSAAAVAQSPLSMAPTSTNNSNCVQPAAARNAMHASKKALKHYDPSLLHAPDATLICQPAVPTCVRALAQLIWAAIIDTSTTGSACGHCNSSHSPATTTAWFAFPQMDGSSVLDHRLAHSSLTTGIACITFDTMRLSRLPRATNATSHTALIAASDTSGLSSVRHPLRCQRLLSYSYQTKQ